jgi:3-oxoacyl-[acyl-carrier protein] reductase
MSGSGGFGIDLTGETALVTGGSRNIGLEIAAAFRSAGARVCVVALSDREALEAAVERLDSDRRQAMGELVDVADEGGVAGLFERVTERLGPISILVNGAASRPHQPFRELSLESWSRALDVILTGAFLTSREMFRRLPEDRQGAIVNLGGLSAHRPARDRAQVIAAKSGLIGLTRALAEEGLGRIRANAVVPGLIATERRPGQSNPHLGESDPRYPVGTSRDVARAVLAFSDPRDVYVTGQVVHVNGGRYMA